MPIEIKKGDSIRYLKTRREAALVIESFRASLGKNKAEFAEFIDMTPENYTHLAKGSVYPSYKVIALIAAAGADIRKLFDLSGEEREDVAAGKVKEEKRKFSPFDMNVAQGIYSKWAIPFGAALPNFNAWAEVVRKIREIDEKDEAFILKTIEAIDLHEGNGDFRWRDVIRSTEKLREHIRKGNVGPNLKSGFRGKPGGFGGVQAKPGKYGGGKA